MTDTRAIESLSGDIMILREKIEAQDTSIRRLEKELIALQDRTDWLPDLTQIPAYKGLLKENNRLSERLNVIKREVGGK